MSLPPGIMIPKFDNTLGSLLIGGLLAMALWGVTCVQTYNYFTGGAKDRPLFRIMVGTLWVLDTFDSALNSHILYYYLVSNYLNPLAILTPVWSIITHVAVTAVTGFAIRCMFAHRIFRLSNGNIPITAWIMAVSTTDLVCGFVITVKGFKLGSFQELDTLSTLMYLDFATNACSDISVAITMCVLLYRSRTGFASTDSIIRVLMFYSVNTGAIVAVDAALGMITYIVMPHNFIFLAFYLMFSKLFLNSYLASLNARSSLRANAQNPVSINLSHISEPHFHGRYGRYDTRTSPGVETVAISVETMVDKKHDVAAERRGIADKDVEASW